jgi:RNA polymerase sigma-70 factor, ECF subfamily
MTILPGESEFIARSRNGDKDAYRVLVQAYQDRIYTLAFSMTRQRELAEDVTQDVFVKAFFALSSFKGDSAFFTWLYRIASNTCLDHLRRRRPNEISIDAPVGEEEDGLERLETFRAPKADQPEAGLEEQAEAVSLLGALTPEQRLILTLREGQGYAYEEIGEIMKCGVNTVKSRLNRAREALKRLYEAKYGNIALKQNVKMGEDTDG